MTRAMSACRSFAKGRMAESSCRARRSLDVATIFIARVIFSVPLTLRMRLRMARSEDTGHQSRRERRRSSAGGRRDCAIVITASLSSRLSISSANSLTRSPSP